MRFPHPIVLGATLAWTLAAGSVNLLNAQRRSRVDDPRPTIYRSATGEWLVDLPPDAEDAIDRYDRDFEAWHADDYGADADDRAYDYSPRQVPWAVIGDFNGDGRTDIAIAGRTERNAVVVLVLSTGRRRYRATELDAEPYDEDLHRSARPSLLRYMYPGRYRVRQDRHQYTTELVLEQPAVQITGSWRPGAVLYAVVRDQVLPYYLADDPLAPRDVKDPKDRRRPSVHDTPDSRDR